MPNPPEAYKRKKRKKTDKPREGWENGTPPPHRDFKERSPVPSVVRAYKILFHFRGTPMHALYVVTADGGRG